MNVLQIQHVAFATFLWYFTRESEASMNDTLNTIEGKWKPETIHYPDPYLEDLLKETYGVMVYQEQVMKVAQIIGDFTLGNADILRRNMSKKKVEKLMAQEADFVAGAKRKGYTEQLARDIFELLKPFSRYGFNKSHAAAYAVLAYRTAYLKCHFPAIFMAANLTNEIGNPNDYYQYLDETRSMGIKILPPNINIAEKNFSVDHGRIVYGLSGIKDIGDAVVDEIVRVRKDGKFKNFDD